MGHTPRRAAPERDETPAWIARLPGFSRPTGHQSRPLRDDDNVVVVDRERSRGNRLVYTTMTRAEQKAMSPCHTGRRPAVARPAAEAPETTSDLRPTERRNGVPVYDLRTDPSRRGTRDHATLNGRDVRVVTDLERVGQGGYAAMRQRKAEYIRSRGFEVTPAFWGDYSRNPNVHNFGR